MSSDSPSPPPPVLDDRAPASDGAKRARSAVLAAVAVGAGLRLVQYLGNRSLWLDEALVAENVLGRGWLQLLAPLHGDQVAPPGFLLLAKLFTLVAGGSEWVLRAPALLCAVAALLVFPRMAARWLAPAGVAWATALFAVYPHLVYFASEVKPYSGDVLATVLLLLAAPLPDRHHHRPSTRRFVALAATLVWLSYPSIFVMAGIAAAAVVERRRESVRGVVRAGLPHLGWSASFAVAYLITRGGADASYVRAWWVSGFAPLPPGPLRDALWYPRALLRLFRDPLGRYDTGISTRQVLQPAAALLASSVGAAVVARRRPQLAAALGWTALAVLVASALHLFPLGADREGAGRVMLFVTPLAALLGGAGLARLSGSPRLWLRWAGSALAAFVILPLAFGAASMVPHGRVELRPLIEKIASSRQPGDVIYVFYQAAPVFRYYAPRLGIRPGEWVAGSCARLDPSRYPADLDRHRGKPRVWALFTVPGTGNADFPERVLLLRHVGGLGALSEQLFAAGAELYLFDLSAPPMTPGVRTDVPRVPQDPAQGCVGPWAPPPLEADS